VLHGAHLLQFVRFPRKTALAEKEFIA